jgi:hypothetical protein
MADLVVTAASVGMADAQGSETLNMIAAAAITAGQVVYRDANGKADLADASVAGTAGARGIALRTVAAGEAVTVLVSGECEGFTIAQAYDAPIFLSDTAGALADAAGTVSVAVGNVSATTDSSLTKLLYVRFPVGN